MEDIELIENGSDDETNSTRENRNKYRIESTREKIYYFSSSIK